MLRRDLVPVADSVLGAFLLYRFAWAYSAANNNTKYPNLIFCALMMAIVMDRELMSPISGRMANLQAYRYSFVTNKQRAVLHRLTEAVQAIMPRLMAAVEMGEVHGIFKLDDVTASVVPLLQNESGGTYIQDHVSKQETAAAKLGRWFALTDDETIQQLLGVSF